MRAIHKLNLKEFGPTKVTFYRTEEPELVKLIPLEWTVRNTPVFTDTGILEEHCEDSEEYHKLMHKIFRYLVLSESIEEEDDDTD